MRRKLFGVSVYEGGQGMRRSLFSNSYYTTGRRKLFSATKVCTDCGQEVDLHEFVCPNCGGKRFSDLCENCSDNEEETVSKTFSNIRNSNRRSLFCNSGNDICDNVFVCDDCGHEFTAKDKTVVGLRCPNCGGNRVVQRDCCSCSDSENPDTCDTTDETLKEFSGTTDTYENVQKVFSDRGLDLDETIKSGYASYNEEDGTVCFSENCDAIRKLFSRLVISVTKELELDPVNSKEALIQRLSNSPTMPPKAIILIKKAHGIIPTGGPISCCESFDNDEDYIKDSGLENDLKYSHDSHMTISDLSNLLKTQYNDAPDDILDKLVQSGIIDINGSSVIINK